MGTFDSPVIREASEADLPRLMDLLHQLSELGERPDEEARSVASAERAALEHLDASSGATCLVIEHDGRVQGTLTLYVLPNLSHGGKPFAIVESVVVDASCRGRGLGRILMEHAEALARARGCYKLALMSNRKRADAHRFYAELGYQPTHQGFTRYFI